MLSALGLLPRRIDRYYIKDGTLIRSLVLPKIARMIAGCHSGFTPFHTISTLQRFDSGRLLGGLTNAKTSIRHSRERDVPS